ncbi:MAG: bifunctional phosphoribosylaminoimidazolecarboxamide formyltransferase/IMP cyclohydrolase [Clostridiales bacterium]|nr:bifunctional phosphoribosylaminoimidazolecarboxamide formyltransferase/IMP cyclohydrolase [Clostridiales bacterium]
MKKRALISVSDKTGVVEFAKGLVALGYEIISTGGTAKALSAAGVKNIGISDITGFPECLDGRVKTLHPAVHAGLLARRDLPDHMKQLEDLNINTIDVVAVNLYPFKQTIMKEGVSMEEAIENIDIGGPTMLRSAAKNYKGVCVVVDPADYETVLTHLKEGTLSEEVRFGLMYKVFQHTAVYDTMISTYMREKMGLRFPDQITFAYEKKQALRYGENPQQEAAFYEEAMPKSGSLARAEQLQGKELSYNNINDTNGALDLLREFSDTAVVACKHANPCGVGIGKNVLEAYKTAYECDPVSIFGGIVAVNRTVDGKTAEEMVKIFLEIVVAPDFTKDALEIFKNKPNLRVLRLPDISSPVSQNSYDMKKVYGGLLVQDHDRTLYDEKAVKVVTKRAPSKEEIKQLAFAYKVVKHAKSNAIVVAKDNAAIGVGGGQTNRIWAAQQAIEHAGERVKGAVLASDAFFPFPDCVEAAAAAGITAIIQPGGSVRDQESIDACDKYNIAMVFVEQRHFKH